MLKGGCRDIHGFKERDAIPCGYARIRKSAGDDCDASTRVYMIDQHTG
jgi:hypothetical protein